MLFENSILVSLVWHNSLKSGSQTDYLLNPIGVMNDGYSSETFRVLKNNELKAFGEYRTRRLVLEAWDKLGLGD